MEVRILLPELMSASTTDNLAEPVYVTAAYPEGLTLKQYHALTDEQRRQHTWRPAVRWCDSNRPERVTESSSNPDSSELPVVSCQ
jgi:hypothetical protein